jgi:hypothetical protein
MKQLILILGLFAWLTGCSKYEFHDKEIKHITKKKFHEKDSITTHCFGDSSKLYQPLAMSLNYPYLFVNDIKFDSAFMHVFDVNEKKYIKNIGRRGRGNDELIGVWRVKSNNQYTYPYDLTLGKMLRYNINRINKKDLNPKEYFLKKKTDLPSLYDFEFLNDSIIVGSAHGSKYRLTFANLKNKSITKKKGHYPLDFNKKYPKNVLSQLFRVNIDIGDNHIIAAGFKTSFIEIYNLKGKLLKTISFPEIIIPEFKVIKRGGKPKYVGKGGIRRTFLDVIALKNYFYVLYSGKKNSNQDYWSKKLYKFDMNGNLIKKIILDRNIANIEYSKKLNVFFGITVNNKTNKSDIVTFKL